MTVEDKPQNAANKPFGQRPGVIDVNNPKPKKGLWTSNTKR